jgi:CubicO group peptidase (beta-lactamase class C family)
VSRAARDALAAVLAVTSGAVGCCFGVAFCQPAVADDATDVSTKATVDCEQIYQTAGHGKSFYEQNPTYFDSRDLTASLGFASPETHGLDSRHLEEGVRRLAASKRIFSVLVAKNGDVVLERYFNGSDSQRSNNIHSASKSIISTLVGIAIDKGYIRSVDQKLSELLPAYFSEKDSRRKKQLTVRHLLTMSAGFEWKDDPVYGTEYEIQNQPDWVEAILALRLVDRPGDKFFYNTGLTHLLSAIISQASGMNTCEFAHRYLFGPIGITAEHWGRDPQGVYSGGYNLYMTPREMMKFGLLILSGGRQARTQVVPREWIRESVTPAFEPYREHGLGRNWWTADRYGYAYNWWLYEAAGHAMVIAWGWGGQMIYVIPDLATAVVLTHDTSSAAAVSEDPVNHDFVRDYILK